MAAMQVELVVGDEEVSNEGSGESSDEDLQKPAEKSSKRERALVPIVFTAFVFVRALDRVFLYRVQKSMASYSATLMSIYWPPLVQVMCFFVCLVYIGMKRYVRGDRSYNMRWFSPWSPKASSQGPVHMPWIAQFSFWDQLNAVISAPPSPFIPLVLQTPLNNTVVLWTAVIAFFYLKTRYLQVHYAGIALIMTSCIVGVVVELQGPEPIICSGLHAANEALSAPVVASMVSEETIYKVANATSDCVIGLPPYKDAQGQVIYIAFGTLALMYALYILSILPAAFGNCYKQKKLKAMDLDVMWSFFWAGMWQVLWGICMFPLVWVPWPKPEGHSHKTPRTLGSDLADSWTCFLGANPSPEVQTCATDPAWVWFAIYLLFNVWYNVLFLWLVKRLSGTWASIGSILCGNLCGILSQYRLFAGDSAEMLTMEQWLALVLSSIAMWVYNIEDEVDVDGKSVYDSGPGGED